jgi:hypothetical protein
VNDLGGSYNQRVSSGLVLGFAGPKAIRLASPDEHDAFRMPPHATYVAIAGRALRWLAAAGPPSACLRVRAAA